MLHEVRRINAFIDTHQPSELHKSLMGLLLISIASLSVLLLETSSQFNYGVHRQNWGEPIWGMGSNGYDDI